MSHDGKYVICSFCRNEQPTSRIANHLIECGNKTEQCPNCEKYVRRAIFAYHYENRCVQLEDDGAINQYTGSARNYSEVRYPNLDTTENNRSTLVKCKFCNVDYEIKDLDAHEVEVKCFFLLNNHFVLFFDNNRINVIEILENIREVNHQMCIQISFLVKFAEQLLKSWILTSIWYV